MASTCKPQSMIVQHYHIQDFAASLSHAQTPIYTKALNHKHLCWPVNIQPHEISHWAMTLWKHENGIAQERESCVAADLGWTQALCVQWFPSMISARTRLPGTAEAVHYSFTIAPFSLHASPKCAREGSPESCEGGEGDFSARAWRWGRWRRRRARENLGETTNAGSMGVGEEVEEAAKAGDRAGIPWTAQMFPSHLPMHLRPPSHFEP